MAFNEPGKLHEVFTQQIAVLDAEIENKHALGADTRPWYTPGEE